MKSCNIFAAGEFSNYYRIPPAAVNIAADKGLLSARKAGINVDLAVGDFDSLGFVPENVETVRHPIEKDDTDTMLAVKIGLSRGCDTLYIYGALGGRLDHTLSNIQTLLFIAERGAKGYIIGDETVTVIKNSSIAFKREAMGNISVFALGGRACGVDIKGLYYPLNNAEISPDFPIGVSNEFIGEPSEISVKNGCIAVVWKCGMDYIDG